MVEWIIDITGSNLCTTACFIQISIQMTRVHLEPRCSAQRHRYSELPAVVCQRGLKRWNDAGTISIHGPPQPQQLIILPSTSRSCSSLETGRWVEAVGSHTSAFNIPDIKLLAATQEKNRCFNISYNLTDPWSSWIFPTWNWCLAFSVKEQFACITRATYVPSSPVFVP